MDDRGPHGLPLRAGRGHGPGAPAAAAAAAPKPAVTVSVWAPDRKTVPGSDPVNSPAVDDLLAVHDDVLDPDTFGVEAAGSPGKILAGALGSRVPPARGRRRRCRPTQPGGEASPPAQAVEPGRDVGELANGLLPRQQAGGPGRRRRAWRWNRSPRTSCRDGPRRRTLPPRCAGPATPWPRSSQSASDSPMGGRSPVRSSSATTMSSRASKGSLPRSAGTSRTRASFVGRRWRRSKVSSIDQVLPPGQRADDSRLLRLRPLVETGALGGIARGRFMRSGTGTANISRHPAGRR